ncbi:hypothetical protein DFH08DRAFT_828704 [Mycena albidolilacea]|uniref:Transmembrane protein n=1 Tax=Mycena albidolilacea TaxID=1033008 RepID=A0AAD7AT99_9AGAR|nr:hypothetical protein DFH08DRAFT_828704 [Mycena albidolilacea]
MSMTSKALILVLCALSSLAVAIPIEAPSKGLYFQFVAQAREIQFENKLGGDLDPRQASTTFFRPVPTLNTASGNFRSLVFEPVESSGGQSWSSCDKLVVSLIVVSAISLALNLVFSILIVSLKRQRRVEVVGIPLRDRHTPRVRPSVRVTPLPPAQMSTTDSTATLVPHTVPSRRL